MTASASPPSPHPLTLGIDASRISAGTVTGTEYYSQAVISALLNLDAPWRYRLYSRTPLPPNLLPPTSNYEIRTMPFPRLWTHLRLSSEMLVHPPDCLFVPAHVLPPVHPTRSLVSVHDIGYKYFPRAHPPLQRLYLDLSTRWNVAAARVVIADSNATRNDIYKFYGTPTEKIRTVYPGYNNQLFRPVRDSNEIARVRAQYGLTQPYLVSVGTLQPRKNYARLIEAFATLPDEMLLVIVGKKGWLFDSILARATNLSVAARVRFLDYVPLGDLPALYTGARAAVLASLHEGFGFPALEAQACDTPLVCSNRAALPEVAGEGAAFVDPMNIAALVQALEAILRNEEWRTVLIERGRRNVERFAWNKTAHELAEIISGL